MTVLILITIFLLMLSGFFSASETAIFSIGKDEVDTLKNGDKREVIIYKLLKSGEETLIVILLCNLFVNISIITMIGKILTNFPNLNIIISFLISTATLLLFGEIIPKNIALVNRDSISRVTAPLLYKITILLKPIVKWFQKINQSLLRINYHYILGIPAPFITKPEYKTVLEVEVEKKSISKELYSSLNFLLDSCSNLVSTVTTHRSKLHIVNRKICIDDKDLTIEINNQEQVIAIIIDGIIEKNIVHFPISKDISGVLEQMQTRNSKIAIIIDEYGSFYGIISFSDILKYWRKSLQKPKKEIKKRVVLGSIRITDILGFIPKSIMHNDENIETINGVLCNWLGRIPKTGEVIKIEESTFYIIESKETNIISLEIVK